MTRSDPKILFKVTYSEYANATSLHMADTMDCSVEKVWTYGRPVRKFQPLEYIPRIQLYLIQVPVCEPVTSQKCAATSYTRCEEATFIKIVDLY